MNFHPFSFLFDWGFGPCMRLIYSTKSSISSPSNGIDLTLIHLPGLDAAYHFHCSVLLSDASEVIDLSVEIRLE